MNSQPGCESKRASELVAMLAKLCNGSITSDHRHDSLVEVSEGLYRVTSDRSSDSISTIPARLLGDGCKLGQRLAVHAGDICKLPERVDTREILHAKVGLHFNAVSVPSPDPQTPREV